jgi:myo-inositol-1(or 4)-monophosphatase
LNSFSPEYLSFMHVARQAAAAGAEMLMDWQPRISVREKGPKDLVSEADLASQQVIREILLGEFPDHDFIGEEEDPEHLAAGHSSAEFRWLVDPLDGTTNYVHGLQPFAVSIALAKGDKVVAGVIHDPMAGEVYTATAGGGAYMNDMAIRTSDCTVLPRALIATSFPTTITAGSIELRRFEQILIESQSIRRLGSAAMNLCYVASGSLDAYFASNVSAWDIAAGWLIVKEAGGVVQGLDGEDLSLGKPKFIAGATPCLTDEIQRVLGTVNG